jgi:hypothetical protein
VRACIGNGVNKRRGRGCEVRAVVYGEARAVDVDRARNGRLGRQK